MTGRSVPGASGAETTGSRGRSPPKVQRCLGTASEKTRWSCRRLQGRRPEMSPGKRPTASVPAFVLRLQQVRVGALAFALSLVWSYAQMRRRRRRRHALLPCRGCAG